MHQQIREPALDGFEIAELGVGGVEPLHQLGDAILEIAQRRVIRMRELNPFELFDQPGEQFFKLVRHRVAGLGRSAERLRERLDTVFQHRHRVPADRAIGEFVDLGAERTNILGYSVQRVVGGDMGHDPAECADRRLQLLERRRVFPGDDHVDLLRQRPHGVVEPGQALGGRQAVQRVADLGEPAFDAGDRRRINTGVARIIDALGERLGFVLERLHDMARLRFGELAADFVEVFVDGGDGPAEIVGRPQRFDSRRHVAQLIFKAGDIDCGLGSLRRGGRKHRRRERGRRLLRRRRERHRLAIEGALALGDLSDGVIDQPAIAADRRPRGLTRQRLRLRQRRRSAPRRRRRRAGQPLHAAARQAVELLGQPIEPGIDFAEFLAGERGAVVDRKLAPIVAFPLSVAFWRGGGAAREIPNAGPAGNRHGVHDAIRGARRRASRRRPRRRNQRTASRRRNRRRPAG